MTTWERIELRPLFEKLSKSAVTWTPEKVLPRTQKIGEIILPQLKNYTDGKYRADRNEGVGFFESIDRFVATNLPISLDHYTNLIDQYKNRVTPYPHYSGIKVTLPVDLADIDDVQAQDIPDIKDEDSKDKGSQLKLM